MDVKNTNGSKPEIISRTVYSENVHHRYHIYCFSIMMFTIIYLQYDATHNTIVGSGGNRDRYG